MSAPDVDPMDTAAARADSIEGGPYVVYLSHAQRIRDVAVAEARRKLVDDLNAEHGCPDCGVHHACAVIVAERDVLRSLVAKLMKGEVTQLTTGDLSFWIHHAGQRIRRDVPLTRDEAKVLAAVKGADRG